MSSSEAGSSLRRDAALRIGVSAAETASPQISTPRASVLLSGGKPAAVSTPLTPVSTKGQYPYRPPRVDPVMFQTDVQPFRPVRRNVANDLRGFQTALTDGMIWRADDTNPLSVKQIDDFIAFSRDVAQEPTALPPGLTGSGYFSTPGSLPGEADPNALEFLHKHDYDVPRAKFRLLCASSVNTAHWVQRGESECDDASGDAGSASALAGRVISSPEKDGEGPWVAEDDQLGLSMDARVVGNEMVDMAMFNASWWSPPHGRPALAIASPANDEKAIANAEEAHSAPSAAQWASWQADVAKATAAVASRAGGDSRRRGRAEGKSEADEAQASVTLESLIALLLDGRTLLRRHARCTARGEAIVAHPRCAAAKALTAHANSSGVDADEALSSALKKPTPVPSKARVLFDELNELVKPGREFVARVCDMLAVGRDDVTLEQLEKELETLSSLPYRIEAKRHMREVVEQAEAWLAEAEKLNEDSGKLPTVRDLAVLETKGRHLPFRVEGLAEISKRLKEAQALLPLLRDAFPRRNWRRARQAFTTLRGYEKRCDELQVDAPEFSKLRENLRVAENWIEKVQKALENRCPFQEMKDLLSDVDQVRVDLSSEVSKADAELRRAQRWLERLRRAVPRQSKTRSAQPVKVELTVLQGLLQEGERIRLDMSNADDVTFCQEVIEQAEEWLESFRGAMESGKDESKASTFALERLQLLLSQGEELSVTMDEQQVLAAEVEARRWAEKAARALQGRMRMEELKTMLSEVHEMRERLPARSRQMLKVREETQMRRALVKAEEWVKAMRQVTAYPQSGERKPVAHVKELIASASDIPVDLTDRVRTLSTAVADAERWGKGAAKLLRQLEGNQKKQKDRLDVEVLTQMMDQAAPLQVEVPQLVTLQAITNSVLEWVSRCTTICAPNTKRQPKKKRVVVPVADKATCQEVQQLIASADDLPARLDEQIESLRDEMKRAAEWQSDADAVLADIVEHAEADDRAAAKQSAREAKARAKRAAEKARARREAKDKSKRSVSVATTDAADDAMEVDEENEEFEALDAELEKVQERIKKLDRILSDAETICVRTVQEQNGRVLLDAVDWARRARKLFLERGSLDTLESLVAEGDELCAAGTAEGETDTATAKTKVKNNASPLEVCQTRELLPRLKAERERCEAWRTKAGMIPRSGDERKPLSFFETMLEDAASLVVVLDEERSMRNEVKRAEVWLSKAKILLQGQQKLSLDKVKSFISDEQKLIVFHRVEVLELQGAVFKAKEWIKQIRESGIEQGEASMHALSGLLGEASDIPAVDLTETTRVLTEATRKYCICRGPYEGFMIGCDMCEEWFHGHCVSITESQADRYEKYVCPSCTIRRYYKKAYDEAVLAIDRCVDPLARAQCRARLRSKIMRRLRKEERTRDEAAAFRDRMRAQSDTMGSTRGVSAAASAVKDAAARAAAATQRADSIQAEELAIAKAEKLEDELRVPTREWALEAQGVLKEYLDDDIFGISKTSALDTLFGMADRGAEVQVHAVIKDKNASTLPDVYAELLAKARGSGLENIEDIQLIVFALRLSGWCALAVDSLRQKRPVATTERVLEAAADVPINDDKVLRQMRNIISKAYAWEGKLSKLLMPGNAKQFDVDKLRALAAEANRIPCILQRESVVLSLIEDGGKRHCLCRGGFDGSYMIECSVCRQWYHGECVRVSERVGEKLGAWQCPYCCDRRSQPYRFAPRDTSMYDEVVDEPKSPPRVSEAVRNFGGGIWDKSAQVRSVGWSVTAQQEVRSDYLELLTEQVKLEGAQGGNNGSWAQSALLQHQQREQALREQKQREQQQAERMEQRRVREQQLQMQMQMELQAQQQQSAESRAAQAQLEQQQLIQLQLQLQQQQQQHLQMLLAQQATLGPAQQGQQQQLIELVQQQVQAQQPLNMNQLVEQQAQQIMLQQAQAGALAPGLVPPQMQAQLMLNGGGAPGMAGIPLTGAPGLLAPSVAQAEAVSNASGPEAVLSPSNAGTLPASVGGMASDNTAVDIKVEANADAQGASATPDVSGSNAPGDNSVQKRTLEEATADDDVPPPSGDKKRPN